LFPGETISSVPNGNAQAQFADFEWAVLRSIAAGTGISAEQISQDYARANYSSIRAGMLDAYATLSRRRGDFETGFCDQVYVAWLEEALETHLKPLMPKGAPDFQEMRTAYANCAWIGPARGWVDPVKERQGAVLGLDAGFSTLQRECAQQGQDYRKVIAQRGVEVRMFRDAGLQLPVWGTADNASEADRKPLPA
jgi:lambda family phage portal protein